VWVKSVYRGTGADARWIAFDDLAMTSICAGPEVEVRERVIFRDLRSISVPHNQTVGHFWRPLQSMNQKFSIMLLYELEGIHR